MESLADQLRKLMGGQPGKALVGMAEQAAQDLSGRGYQVYAQEAKAMGQQPMAPQDWAQQQRGR